MARWSVVWARAILPVLHKRSDAPATGAARLQIGNCKWPIYGIYTFTVKILWTERKGFTGFGLEHAGEPPALRGIFGIYTFYGFFTVKNR
jgi:hypothetical protein